MSQPVFAIGQGDLPVDVAPGEPEVTSPSEWYNADFPHSTPDAPYGYFDGPDGPDFARPRKKRPRGYTGDAKPGPGTAAPRQSGSVGARRTPATESQARQAAALLASLNAFMGMGLAFFGLPMTAEVMKDANKDFEDAAYNALLNDPTLCRKILSAGAGGAKAQLTLAYLGFAAALGPVAWMEFQTKKELAQDED